MGRKQKIQAEANAEKTSGPHDESPPRGGGAAGGRPAKCGPLVFSAFATACIFCVVPYCFFCFCAYCIELLGRLGPTINVFSASLYTSSYI